MIRSTSIPVLVSLLFVVQLRLAAWAAPPDEIPPGVIYKRLPAQRNEAARAWLAAQLRTWPASLARSAGDQGVTVGPFLMAKLAATKSFPASSFSRVVSRVAVGQRTLDLPGLVARGPAQLAKLAEALREVMQLKQPRLRQLTSTELALIWMFIAWDIEEPIFALEDGQRTFVVRLANQGNAVIWLEELDAPCIRAAGRPDCFCVAMEHRGKTFVARPQLLDGARCAHAAMAEQPARPGAKAKPLATLEHVHLLQSPSVMDQRIRVQDAADYIKRLVTAADKFWNGQPHRPKLALELFIAIKPGGERRIWMVAAPGSAQSPHPGLAAEHRRALLAVPPPPVRAGLYVVMIKVAVAGAKHAEPKIAHYPGVWTRAAKGSLDPSMIEQIALKTW